MGVTAERACVVAPSTSLARAPAAFVAAAALLLPCVAQAQPVTPPTAPEPAPSAPEPVSEPEVPDAALEEAKTLFRQGNELRKAGDWQGALARYLRSRARVPSLPNTMNAAICLDYLGRFDEALELYEQVLTDFPGEVTDEVRKNLARAMGALRAKVGGIDVSADVHGAVVVDGRMRGTLPLLAPVRVLPGTRRIQVIADGYATWEGTVAVAAGQSVAVTARMEPLRTSGRLRVEARGLEGGDVFVDGAAVGRLPWEGNLAPGSHLVWVRKDDIGSAPHAVAVIAGQAVRLPLEAQALGPEMRILATPATAELFVDGTRIGRGSWRGRLTVGRTAVEARETGYLPARSITTITVASAPDVALELARDDSHVRWRTAERARFFVEALGGVALGATLGSGAEQACERGACTEDGAVVGMLAAARGGYELANRLSFGVAIGWLRVGTDIERGYSASYRADQPETAEVERQTVSYRFQDALLVSGPFVLGGVGYRVPLGARFEIALRLEAGALLARASDVIDGQVSNVAGDTRAVDVTVSEEDGNFTTAVGALLVPQVGLQIHAGRLHLGAGLALVANLVGGPALRTGQTQVRPSPPCSAEQPQNLSCAPRESFVAGEDAFGRFVLWTPNVFARFDL
jgi:hypothetical protein